MVEDLYNESCRNGWLAKSDTLTRLSPYELSFFGNEFLGKRTLPYYKQRLERIGFREKANALDLACGMGQWTVGLGQLNSRALGVDINKDRLAFARELCVSHSLDNCDLQVGSMEAIPAADSSFDAIFCYGAFMFSEMPAALKEMRRVAKNDALIYINANSFGWYLHLLLDRGLFKLNLSMMRTAIKMMFRGIANPRLKSRPQTQMLVRPSYILDLAQSLGMEVVEYGPEGTIGDTRIAVLPAYPKKFYGFVGIYEYLIRVRKEA